MNAAGQPVGGVMRGTRLRLLLHESYEVDVQWVPTSSSPAVRDMRLRPTRSIPAGQRIVVSVDATRCGELPGEIHCISDPGVHALPADRTMDVCRIAQEERPSAPEGVIFLGFMR